MVYKTLILSLMVSLVALIQPAFAQEAEESYLYSYGTVARVSAQQAVILEYDFEQDEEREVVYAIDSNTEFEGVDSYDQLEAGSDVEIFYEDIDGVLTARLISEDSWEEEEWDEEYDGEDMGAEGMIDDSLLGGEEADVYQIESNE